MFDISLLDIKRGVPSACMNSAFHPSATASVVIVVIYLGHEKGPAQSFWFPCSVCARAAKAMAFGLAAAKVSC